MERKLKQYTDDDLRRGDGKQGRSSLFVYKGKVYEVSSRSKHWKNGVHFKKHIAGHDLTKDMELSPHGADILKNTKLVGDFVLHEETAGERPDWFVALSLRHHAHPISVHYPIALSVTAALFSIMNIISDAQVVEVASVFNQIVASLFTPISILTGCVSWRYNYKKKRTFEFLGKIILSILYPIPMLGALGLYGYQYFYSAAYPSGPLHGLYHILVIVSAVLALSLGYLGGRITFPD